MFLRSLRTLGIAAALAVLALLPATRQSALAASHVGPKAYYLALGDSLAFGYQPNFDFSHGYANDVYAHLQPLGTSHLVNMACPDETSGSFINGGCPYWYLRKTFYLGSQLNAALSFIGQHAGQVSPVTIDIGANDVLPLVNTSTCTASSTYATAFSTFDANFTSILSRLRTALNGRGDLVAMNYYDPYQNLCASNPQILSLLQTFNAHIAADAAPYGVPVADVFGAFGGATTPNANICAYTWMCSSNRDIHATAQGYAVMATAFESAAGY